MVPDETAQSKAQEDLKKPVPDLLAAVYWQCDAIDGPGAKGYQMMAKMMKATATMSARVAMESDKLQRKVYWLTWLVVGLTVVQVGLAILAVTVRH
jgi:hypothetical protein